jgi:two-component sensor histidine kinase
VFDTATVQILEGDSLRVVASTGFSENSPVSQMVFPLTERFPNYRVVTSGRALALGDIRTDFPHFVADRDDFDSGHIRSWLGVPLIDRGTVIGMVTLDRTEVHPFQSDDVEIAAALAHHAAVAITNARLYKQLQDANQNQDTLLRELHHRVKNNMQLVSSLLNVRIGTIEDESVRTILAEIRTQIGSLATVHDSLYRSPTLEHVELDGYIGAVVRDIEEGYLPGGRGIEIAFASEFDARIHIDKAIPLGLLVSELVLNAVKHAYPDPSGGRISITVARGDDESTALVKVADDGVGLPDDVADGFGMILIQSLTAQINGTTTVDGPPGTTWRVSVPLA